MLLSRSAFRISASVGSVVLVGIWINIYTNELPRSGYFSAAVSMGWSNLLLALGIICLSLGEIGSRRWRMHREDEFQVLYKTLQQRQRRVLESTLRIVCTLVSQTLRIPVNARYFPAEQDEDGRYYMRQDRDLAVLNIHLPREYGFTRIYVDTPHIVAGRSFRERLPLFEELPADHSDRYEPEVGRMIEPKQRWVLACPVLRLDALTNSHGAQHPPHGVIVFYGTQVPAGSAAPVRIQSCLDFAEQFAEQMSHVLNMLDLSSETEERGDDGTGNVT